MVYRDRRCYSAPCDRRSTQGRSKVIDELRTVVLTADLPQYDLRAGDLGAVVMVHQQGKGYTVEFTTLGATRSPWRHYRRIRCDRHDPTMSLTCGNWRWHPEPTTAVSRWAPPTPSASTRLHGGRESGLSGGVVSESIKTERTVGYARRRSGGWRVPMAARRVADAGQQHLRTRLRGDHDLR